MKIIDFKCAREDKILKRIDEIKLAKGVYNAKNEDLDSELEDLIEELQANEKNYRDSGRLGKSPHTNHQAQVSTQNSTSQEDLIRAIVEAEANGLKVSNVTFVEENEAVLPKIFIYYRNKKGNRERVRNVGFYGDWVATLFDVLKFYKNRGGE